MIELFVPAFVTYFVIIDPIGLAPLFANLTEGTPAAHKRRMAIRAVIVAALIIVGFAYGGDFLLAALGISLDAFRAAGGVLLFLIALDMIFETRKARRDKRNDEVKEHRDTPLEDISVFPIATPLISGPGCITTTLLYMKQAGGDTVAQLTVLGAAGANLLLTLVIFLAVGPLLRVLGDTVAQTIGRILGVILAALSIQLVFDAITGTFMR